MREQLKQIPPIIRVPLLMVVLIWVVVFLVWMTSSALGLLGVDMPEQARAVMFWVLLFFGTLPLVGGTEDWLQ